MSTTLLFLILGLGSGAAYAALALGLVVTYRSSGVVNLATGAVALYVAYTYAFLRQGELVDPVLAQAVLRTPDTPDTPDTKPEGG